MFSCFESTVAESVAAGHYSCCGCMLSYSCNKEEKPAAVFPWRTPEQYLYTSERLVFSESAGNSWVDCKIKYWDVRVPLLTLCEMYPLPQRQRLRLPWIPAVDRTVVGHVLSGAGRHRRQLPGAVFHTFHRGRLFGAHQLHFHLRCFQEDDKAGPLPPDQHWLWSQPCHSVRLPLHAWCVVFTIAAASDREKLPE